jgi:hypothetical protein
MPWRASVLAFTVGVGIWAIHRAFRLSLEASTDRVLVRNYWRDYEFNWLDVTRVGMGEVPTGPTHQPAIAFQLRTGQWVLAQATPGRVAARRLVLDALEALAPPSVEVVR